MTVDCSQLPNTRKRIISEIRRLAIAANGKLPGKMVFSRQTGIGEHQWSGVIWSRWSDALAEAGFEKNELQARFETSEVVARIAEVCRRYGRVPTVAEMKLCRRGDASFPSKGAIASHFPTRATLLAALAKHAAQNSSFRDITAMLPDALPELATTPPSVSEGVVYLLISGTHYKIGRSDTIERRIKEIRVTLPEVVTLLHVIRTDDPSGIEAYWHRRFADRRANGEWFKLTPADVEAFKRRKYQ